VELEPPALPGGEPQPREIEDIGALGHGFQDRNLGVPLALENGA
jgi:hypothetical protein